MSCTVWKHENEIYQKQTYHTHLIKRVTHLKLSRVHIVQARQHGRRDSILQKVYSHKDQRVAGYCHVLGVVDVVKLSPQLDHENHRPESPVHYYWNIKVLFDDATYFPLLTTITLRVTVKQMSVSNSDTVVEVQINFEQMQRVFESQYGHLGLDKVKWIEDNCK